MKSNYVDAHMHVPKETWQMERAMEIIEQEGISTLAVSVDIPSYYKLKEISKGTDWLDISFGIHPIKAFRYAGQLNKIQPYLEESPRIGEIGLCKYWATDYEAQKRVFDYQLEYARKVGKTVNLHTAGYEWEVVKSLERNMPPAVLVHWYSGPVEAFRELNSMGCYFSFGVNMIAKGADCSDPVKSSVPVSEKILLEVPINRILTETDGIEARNWIDGHYSYADSIPQIIRKIAELRDEGETEMRHKIWENYRTFIAFS